MRFTFITSGCGTLCFICLIQEELKCDLPLYLRLVQAQRYDGACQVSNFVQKKWDTRRII